MNIREIVEKAVFEHCDGMYTKRVRLPEMFDRDVDVFIDGIAKRIEAELSQPANDPEPPKIQHVLSRDQRDALVAANVLLTVMQVDREEMFNRIQQVVDVISDMLYEERLF